MYHEGPLSISDRSQDFDLVWSNFEKKSKGSDHSVNVHETPRFSWDVLVYMDRNNIKAKNNNKKKNQKRHSRYAICMSQLTCHLSSFEIPQIFNMWSNTCAKSSYLLHWFYQISINLIKDWYIDIDLHQSKWTKSFNQILLNEREY